MKTLLTIRYPLFCLCVFLFAVSFTRWWREPAYFEPKPSTTGAWIMKDQTWQHITMIYDAGELKVYVDSQPVTVDQIVFYDKALSPEQVRLLYSGSKIPDHLIMEPSQTQQKPR